MHEAQYQIFLNSSNTMLFMLVVFFSLRTSTQTPTHTHIIYMRHHTSRKISRKEGRKEGRL